MKKSTIDEKIKVFKELGYSDDEIISMIKLFPTMLGLKTENIKGRMNKLGELGYNDDDVHTIIRTLPTVIGYSEKGLAEKFELLSDLKLSWLIVKKPHVLMVSPELVYARHCFLKERGLLDEEEAYNQVFTNAKRFESKYKVTKEQLLKDYKYSEYKDNKSSGQK